MRGLKKTFKIHRKDNKNKILNKLNKKLPKKTKKNKKLPKKTKKQKITQKNSWIFGYFFIYTQYNANKKNIGGMSDFLICDDCEDGSEFPLNQTD